MNETFKEKFPKLSECAWVKGEAEFYQPAFRVISENRFYSEYDVEHECINKQRVKEVIEKLRAKHHERRNDITSNNIDRAMHEGAYISLGDLLKELKLGGMSNDKCVYCETEIIYNGKKAVCKNGHQHADGSYAYLCGSNYCRCSQ